MQRFHRKCGDRVTLLQNNLTAIRNFIEFNHGLIFSEEPLQDDIVFEVCIDRKVDVWNGSLEIGVTTQDPESIELPATATKLKNTAWIMICNSIANDGTTIVSNYGQELDSLREGDRVGVMRSSRAELVFFINGRSLGVAVNNMPSRLYAVVDMYGQCVQVSITQHSTNGLRPLMESSLDQTSEDPNNDDTLTASDGEAAALAPEPECAFPKDYREDYIPMSMNSACALISRDFLRFHPRCGILVLLTNNNKTAERARPLDDYNNGVVMTQRPLHDDEIFEIRIDRLVDKWSGSIEVGVSSHNPANIRYPSTMTNMDSGTVMMSGSKILINGHGTYMEYGHFNLDELKVGDKIGMMRKTSGQLHFYINGIDQGVAARNVDPHVWGVVDLYGMTVKVTIIDKYEDDTNIDDSPPVVPSTSSLSGLCRQPLPSTPASGLNFTWQMAPTIDEDSLLFHTMRDSNVVIINNGKTAHRPNALEFFNNGIVMTNRTLRTNELFQVKLDLVISKWSGSIEIGVTRHSSNAIQFPYKMSNAKSGTWALIGEDVIRDGSIIIPQYVRNLNRLGEGDTVGVIRRDMGILHFLINGVDQGPAAFNVPEQVFGIIDLFGRIAQATIVDVDTPPFPLPRSYSPDSPVSTESNITSLPDMCFHSVHGRNAILSRSRVTASRAAVYSEFNDAVLFSSRPMRECEMFELRIDSMVDCWIGSIEIGVTAIRPDDLEASGGLGAIAGTATDLSCDTYILSGCAIMKDGECVRSGYTLDLDKLTVGSRVGMMWHADRSLHYYLDGMDTGKAWYVPNLSIYAVVDLYGQCTQVTILQNEDRTFNFNGYSNADNLMTVRTYAAPPQPYWSFSEYSGPNVSLSKDFMIAKRKTADPTAALVFSSSHLALGEMFEIKIMQRKFGYAGNFRIGVTDINILNAHVNRCLPPSISYLPHFTTYIDGKYLWYSSPGTRYHQMRSMVPTFEWLRPGDRIGLKKTSDRNVQIYYNCELLDVVFENVPDKVYVVMEIFGEVLKIQTVTKAVANILPPPIYNEDFIKPEMENSLEMSAFEGLENAAASTSGSISKATKKCRNALPYTFYDVHGKNIKLCSSDTVAVRFRGYNEGVAIVSQPFKRGQVFRFRVDKVDMVWSGSVALGAVVCLPEELPVCGAQLEPPAWVLTSEICCDNNVYSFKETAIALEYVIEQSVLTIEFGTNSQLGIWVDSNFVGTAGTVPDDIPQVYPLVDLYGKVSQVSILLHPYLFGSTISPDLPNKSDNHDDSFVEAKLSEDCTPSDPEAGSSDVKAEWSVRAHSHDSLVEDLRGVHVPRTMHQSLILPQPLCRYIRKSHSSHNFNESDILNPRNTCVRRVCEYNCDTNIQHNDCYPEVNDVDNLDIEIMNALTLETGNLPDLSEEQSSSIDESTRRDDIYPDLLSIENMNYLNNILCLDEGIGGAGCISELDLETCGETCEHLNWVLKFWNELMLPYPELRLDVLLWQVKCFCLNCHPDPQAPLSGWVRIARIDALEEATCAYWPITRSILKNARSSSGRVRRPRGLVFAPPACTPPCQIWLDEKCKLRESSLAIEIEVDELSPDNDRMRAFLIYLKSHEDLAEDSPTSLDE